MRKLQIGQIFRYSIEEDEKYINKDKSRKKTINGCVNFYWATESPSSKVRCNLTSGINPIAKIGKKPEERTPAILIRSSPNKSKINPWPDIFNVDMGYIKYYGQNKEPGKNPSLNRYNKPLLAAYETHNHIDLNERKKSVPIIFFQTTEHNGRSKGYIKFQGFGIITNVELVTQVSDRGYFTNHLFEFAVFDLTNESEVFNWDWISDRRNPSLKLDKTLSAAPKAWKDFIAGGASSLESYRRNVTKLSITKTSEQKPKKRSKEEKVIQAVYKFYAKRKTRFECLAEIIAEKVISDSTRKYQKGWITQKGSDGGVDFVGRIDIGEGFGKTKLVVLGQAKCESLDTPTGGNHIARTVARLRRGWLGVYVTTSYFSDSVQKEIINDKYPILLINGKKIAEELIKMQTLRGFKTIDKLLLDIDSTYDSRVKNNQIEDVLL